MGGDVLTWTALIAGSGSLLAWAGFWMRMGSDRQRVTNVETVATANGARVEMLGAAFSEYKEKAALHFATTGDLADAERRFASAVDGLGSRFDRMAERLDRVLETLSHASHARGQ